MNGRIWCDTVQGWILLIFLMLQSIVIIPSLSLLSEVSAEQVYDIPEEVTSDQIVFSGVQMDHVSISLDPLERMDVTWVDSRDGNPEIYYLKLSGTGWKLHNDMRLTDSPGGSIHPSALPLTGTTSMITWVEEDDDGFDLMTTLLDYDGKGIQLMDDPVIVGSGSKITSGPVTRKFPGGGSVIGWAEVRGGTSSIHICTFEGSNNSSPVTTEVIGGIGNVTHMDLEVVGNNELSIVWNGIHGTRNITDHNYGIYYMRVGRNGTLLSGPMRKSITGPNSKPDIVGDGEVLHLIFSSARYSRSGLVISSFNVQGEDILDDIPLSPNGMICHDPSVAIEDNGDLSLLWWRETEVWDLFRGSVQISAGGIKLVETAPLSLDIMRTGTIPPQGIGSQGELRTLVIDNTGDGMHLVTRTKPDLQWTGSRMFTSGKEPIVGENLTVDAVVHNGWSSAIHDVDYTVSIHFDGELLYRYPGRIDLEKGSLQEVSQWLIPSFPGSYMVSFHIDPFERLDERNRSNNLLVVEVDVKVQSFEIRDISDSAGSAPGEQGRIDLRVVNDGSAVCEIIVEALGERLEWLHSKEASVELAPGGSSTLSFTVLPPVGEVSGERIFLFEAMSNRTKTDRYLLRTDYTIDKVFSTIVDLGNYRRDLDPGSDHSLPLKIMNNGNTPMEYRISANHTMPLDLTYNGAPLPIIVGPVGPGKETGIPIDLSISMNTTPGTDVGISLTIEALEGGQIFRGDYNLTVSGLPLLFIEYPEGSEITIDDDWNPFDVPLLVENRGNARDMFRFDIPMDPDEWFVEIFDPGEKELSLSPGENRTITLHIIPPKSPDQGIKTISINAIPLLRPELRFPASLDIVVGSSYDVEMDMNSTEIIPDPGSPSRILISFTNTGNLDGTFLINIEGPGASTAVIDEIGGGRYTLNESGPLPLQRGGTFSFWLEIEIPHASASTEINIRVTCLEDREVSTSMLINVKGSDEDDLSILFYIAAGALLLSLVGILFIVTRFLRSRRESSKMDLMDEQLDDDEDDL